jgi:hypothetical protein
MFKYAIVYKARQPITDMKIKLQFYTNENVVHMVFFSPFLTRVIYPYFVNNCNLTTHLN